MSVVVFYADLLSVMRTKPAILVKPCKVQTLSSLTSWMNELESCWLAMSPEETCMVPEAPDASWIGRMIARGRAPDAKRRLPTDPYSSVSNEIPRAIR